MRKGIVALGFFIVLFIYSEIFAGEAYRPLSASFRLRQEYDDNVYTSEIDKASSWKTIFQPKVDLRYSSPLYNVGLTYQFSYTYFESRVDREDMGHSITASAYHKFSPLITATLRDTFRREQEPEVVETIIEEGGRSRDIMRRRKGDYVHNRVSGSVDYLVLRSLYLVGRFSNTVISYEDPKISVNSDRVENLFGASIRYVHTLRTSFSASYQFQNVDYDSEETKVDSGTNIYYLGVSHTFSPIFVGYLNAGYQKRTFEAFEERGEIDDTSPYIEGSVGAQIGENLTLRSGYRYSITETEQSVFLSQQLQLIYLSLNYTISPKFSVGLDGSSELGHFDLDVARVPAEFPEDLEERSMQYGIVFRYKIARNWSLETGWRHINNDSDFPEASYDRNRGHVGISAKF